MSSYLMDQYVGKINIIASNVVTLGQQGYVSDEAITAGSQLGVSTSGCPIGVRVCKKVGATAGLTGGYGVKFKAGTEGFEVDALSGAAGVCDGVVDPALTADLAADDTFLLYESGPFKAISAAAWAVGEQIKPAASGKFTPVVGNEAGVGRGVVAATGADELKRGFFNLGINAKGGLLA